jgi:hypothetical protein
MLIEVFVRVLEIFPPGDALFPNSARFLMRDYEGPGYLCKCLVTARLPIQFKPTALIEPILK